jgi:hypothetical protein
MMKLFKLKKRLTTNQKALKKMEIETNRAIASVQKLENLYLKIKNKPQTKER